MAQHTDRKILRIGLIKNGRVVKEHLLHKLAHVTVGTSEKCTFQLSIEGLPPIYSLIKVINKRYHLQFTTKMDGRLTVGGQNNTTQTLDLKTIAQEGLSKASGKFQVLELNDRMRGKLEIGEFNLLFQFITPPPPRVKPQLPAAYKRNIWKSLDWPFANILLCSFILQSSSLSYLVTRDYPPKEVDIAAVVSRFAEIMQKIEEVKPPPPVDLPEQKKPEKVVKNDEPTDEVIEEKELPKPDTPENKAKRREILTEKVTQSTALKYLVSGTGGGTNIVGELSGEAARTSIAEVFDGVGLAVAGSDVKRVKGLAGETSGKTMGIDNSKLKGKRTGKVRSGKKREKKLKGRIKVSRPSEAIGTGTLSRDKIQRVVQRRSRGLKGCYEAELKKNNTLQGLVKIRFTIEPSGRVSSSKAIQNTMGSRAVAGCIEKQIKRWRFAKPSGGSVTITYPFVFTPSN
jgi:TonB family protein